MHNFVHIKVNFFGYLNSVLYLNCFFSQDFNLLRNFNIFDSFRARNLLDDLNLNRFLYFNLDNFGDGNCLGDRLLSLDNLRNFNDIFNDFFSDNGFLDNELYGNFMFEWNHNLSVFNCHLMYLN